MADQSTNYQCLACGGPLHFDGKLGKLKCDYCESTYTIEEAKEFYRKKNEAAQQAAESANEQAPASGAMAEDTQTGEMSSAGEGWGQEAQSMRAYNCPSCGAELVCDETTAATSCPYCGNPTVIPAQFSGMKRPDYCIPFKIEKNEAIEKLGEYYKGKKLLPKAFLSGNHIEEIKGVYVPFWLFNGTVDADMSFEGGKDHVRREGDYEITKTEIYDVRRRGEVTFEKIPVDAATKMPDDLMDSIEPFGYEDLKPFEMEYLPGYLANKYDVSQEDCIKHADERATNSAVNVIRQTIGAYDHIQETGRNIRIRRDKTEYAMLPVWLLSTKWNDQNFLFAMNGQTGVMTGNLPVSKGKLTAWFLGVFAAVLAVMLLLMGVPEQAGPLILMVLVPLLIAGVVSGSLQAQMKPVGKKHQAANYIKTQNVAGQGASGRTSPERYGAVRLKVNTDTYLRTTEKRVRIQSAPSNGPGAGGAAPGAGNGLHLTGVENRPVGNAGKAPARPSGRQGKR